MSERRKNPRREIQRVVQAVTLHDSRPPITCTLLDISQTGARLHAADPGSFPNEFLLVLRGDIKRWCRLVNATKDEIGVRFIAPPVPG